jgi:hypothetical protein
MVNLSSELTMTKKFRKAKNLVKSAKDSWVDKKVKIEDCISNLSEAITIMVKLILLEYYYVSN